MDLAPWELVGITGLPLVVLVVVLYLMKSSFDSLLNRGEQRLSQLLEAQVHVDLDLREKRETWYVGLWQCGRLLPLYPRNDSLTYGDLRDLMISLRNWYFEGGGLYLSDCARYAYTTLQETLGPIVANNDAASACPARDYETVQKAFSALRTQLTLDLQSRVRTERVHGR